MKDFSSSSAGFFNHAHHFVLNNPTMINMKNDNHSLELLAKQTITGTEFDSSARDPPPRCHPGTRLDISKRLQQWLENLIREKRFTWVNGPAGVGKSAIMQTLSEALCDGDSPEILGATLFFSRASKRDDPQRVVLTLAYQLAVKFPSYRHYVVGLLDQDPKVVEKSFSEQFKRFIVKPFAKRGSLPGLQENTILIVLDGLDECAGERAQREIVLTIGGFVLQNPGSPLAWIVSSRPEPHIRATFESKAISSAWMQIEVPVNSPEACADVERYLRFEFDGIKEKYPLVFDETEHRLWPPEAQFTRVAKSSSGLFAFATTAVRFVDDEECANPISQLKIVLDVIDSVEGSSAATAPFATLDALYTEIMSRIPSSVLATTKRILYSLIKPYPTIILSDFSRVCCWLNLTQADAYSALQKLHAVLRIPKPENKDRQLQVLHASFMDYLTAPKRSGPFVLSTLEAKREHFQSCSRILGEAHDLEEVKVSISRINLSWPARGEEIAYRSDLALQAFNLLLLAEPEVLRGSPWSESSYRVSFLRDLDLQTITSSSTRGPHKSTSDWLTLWPLLISIHTSPFSSRLREDKLFQISRLSALSLECIDIDQLRIFKNCHVELGSCPDTQGDEHVEALTLLKKFGPVVLPTDDWMINPRCNDTTWKTSLLNDIKTAQEERPEQHVVLYGQGSNENVLIRLIYPDAEWLLFTAYRS